MKKIIWNVVLALLVLLVAVFFVGRKPRNTQDAASEIQEIATIESEPIEERKADLEETEETKEALPETVETEKIPSENVMPEESETEEPAENQAVPKEPDISPTACVEELSAKRVARNRIEITFEKPSDVENIQYCLMRKDAMSSGNDGWIVCKTISGEETTDSNTCIVADTLDSTQPKQYLYRVDIKTADGEKIVGQPGKEILASNVLVCIDPGHYAGKNAITTEENYGYAEGDYTIKIGLALRDILKQQYGIDSYLTRENGSITIDGYTDAKLDRGHISLRGEYAGRQDSDLFISLHTNANNDNANGYPTCLQPIEINKTLVLANIIACGREDIIKIGNSIGINVSQVNYGCHISTIPDFTLGTAGMIPEWTAEYNDSLNTPGSIRCRLGEEGDYYGVLKGATRAGVPGLIVEHGMHTAAVVRKEAMTTDLYNKWAQADAYGIAYGFGFEENIQMMKE